MPILIPYAAMLAVLFMLLSIRTIRMRRRLRIAVGHGEDIALLRAMRAHANFAEYVPFALVLLFFAATASAPAWLMHALGVALVAGRISHAYGVSHVNESYAFRVFGMAMTLSVIGIAACWLAYRTLSA